MSHPIHMTLTLSSRMDASRDSNSAARGRERARTPRASVYLRASSLIASFPKSCNSGVTRDAQRIYPYSYSGPRLDSVHRRERCDRSFHRSTPCRSYRPIYSGVELHGAESSSKPP